MPHELRALLTELRLLLVGRRRSRRDLNAEAFNRYSRDFPSNQNAVDIFSGEWSSQIPPEFGVDSGGFLLFSDPRVRWAIATLGGVEDQTILELGPLEAGHTYMLKQAGAKHITSIEGNVRAFLKCLIVREITKLESVDFLFGDFTKYLESPPQQFEVIFANGVLYHMMEPLQSLAQMAKATNRIAMTTHYYDAELIGANPAVSRHFDGTVERREHEGYQCELHLQTYQPDALGSLGFCGGSQSHSYWMCREDILAALKHFGFSRVEVGCEDPNAANGPAFTVVGIRG